MEELPSDREIAQCSNDMKSRGVDYRIVDLPGYVEWSNRKLAEGESAALIANLDATGMILLPEEVSQISDADYEELLSELKSIIHP